MIAKETIVYILAFLGAGTLALFLYAILCDLKDKFRTWRLNKCRIKCLCHHQFEERMVLPHWEKTEYVLRCRKCKKRKVIVIWKEETEEGGADHE